MPLIPKYGQSKLDKLGTSCGVQHISWNHLSPISRQVWTQRYVPMMLLMYTGLLGVISYHRLSSASKTEYIFKCSTQIHILKFLGVTLTGKNRREFCWGLWESLLWNHHWISDIAAYRYGEGCWKADTCTYKISILRGKRLIWQIASLRKWKGNGMLKCFTLHTHHRERELCF